MKSKDMRGEHLNLAREVTQQLAHINLGELESLSDGDLNSFCALLHHWSDLSHREFRRRLERVK